MSAHANAHTREETPPAQTAEEAPDAKVIPIPTSDSKRATRLPQDWKPSERMAEWTLEQGVTRDEAIRTLARFRDYWAAASGRNAAKKDWQAAWRNWVRDDIDRGRIGQQARRRAATTQLAWDAGVVYR
ncbi:DnaT-like ssDNA-binding domain-containing protein [Frankia sp. R82]|uniref:DnaT-like ssDNA-binding domain-containing protein n=1 Tax=Frankia sp. R82 TaxID=2950553 RepID=UPI0020437937|nr:DnaT-like ssDNA-binding domain-containing protein [Frankia sp. R82]MCM3884129.1 DnaT-like ssDNA-binding domain-containing protein [Frankia sp. R82]